MVKHLRSGLVTELTAQLHYVSQGYEIFLPVSQHTPVDFIAYRDGRFVRVQAKTASTQRKPSGNYLTVNVRGAGYRAYGPDDFDELFVACGQNKWVIPWRAVCNRSSFILNRVDADGALLPYRQTKASTLDSDKWRVT